MTGGSPARLRSPMAGICSDAMLDRALDYGLEYYDLDLRTLIAAQSRRMIGRQLSEPGSRLTREELFFALVVEALHQIDRKLVAVLSNDIRAYHRCEAVGDEVLRRFVERSQQLAIDTLDYWEWVSRERQGRSNRG